MRQRRDVDDLTARSQAVIEHGRRLKDASQSERDRLRMVLQPVAGAHASRDRPDPHDGVPPLIRATARTLVLLAQSLDRLLHQTPTPDAVLVVPMRRLERRMWTFQHAVSIAARAQSIYAFDDEGQCGIDGQLAELAGRVRFIARHIGSNHIPPERLAAYVHGLITDVDDLLDDMAIDPSPIPEAIT